MQNPIGTPWIKRFLGKEENTKTLRTLRRQAIFHAILEPQSQWHTPSRTFSNLDIRRLPVYKNPIRDAYVTYAMSLVASGMVTQNLEVTAKSCPFSS